MRAMKLPMMANALLSSLLQIIGKLCQVVTTLLCLTAPCVNCGLNAICVLQIFIRLNSYQKC